MNGADYTQVSYELAQKVQNNLVALGLTNRGVFQMQVGDEFAVIRCAREAGIPGILIEHGFISNWGDANKYFSDAGCKRLGEADADAIIAQFPKSSWLDYSSVFDADYYLNKYPDVNEWANGSKDKALDHFINYGMSEAAAAPRRSTCRATTMSTPISAPPSAPTSPATTRTTLCTARRRGATPPAARSSRAPQPRRAAWTTLPSTTPSTTSSATATSRRPSPSDLRRRDYGRRLGRPAALHQLRHVGGPPRLRGVRRL